MYFLTVKAHFDAAHQIRSYPGKCSRIHGHTWEVEMIVAGSSLDETGLLVDFGELKKILRNAVSALDHNFLNEMPPFDKINPTAENIARFLYEAILDEVRNLKVVLSEIKVWESPRAAASYRPAVEEGM